MIYLPPRLFYSGSRSLYLSFDSQPIFSMTAIHVALLNETPCPMPRLMGSSTLWM
jgi:hypothetical protein